MPSSARVKRLDRAIVVGASALVLTAGLVACGGDDDDDTTGDEVVIGNSIPLTGSLETFGASGQKAAELAVAQINEAIATAGAQQTVTLENADNGTNPEGAVEAARELADKGAGCIAGAWASADTIPTAREVSIPEGILQISPASSADEISALEDEGLLNRTVLPDRLQGPALAQGIAFALGGAEGKSVNIGARKDSYGVGIADTFSDAWEGSGGSIGERVEYKPGLSDYSSEAQRITSGNPDAIVIIDRSDNFPDVGQALVATDNWDPAKAWGTDGLVSSDLVEDPGPEAVRGMRATAPGTPDDAAPSEAFGKLFESSEPKDVTQQTFSAQNFDAVILCYLASVAAGSTDGKKMAAELQGITGPGGTKYTWEQLPEAIDALQKGKDIDYVGASGELDLDKAGDATAGAYDLYEFKNELTIAGAIPVPAPK